MVTGDGHKDEAGWHEKASEWMKSSRRAPNPLRRRLPSWGVKKIAARTATTAKSSAEESTVSPVSRPALCRLHSLRGRTGLFLKRAE
jgi:hypothetical protein